jgi:hypothetical protein
MGLISGEGTSSRLELAEKPAELMFAALW